ncbi:hypothetical protein YC2023_104623 [Brassica napus]
MAETFDEDSGVVRSVEESTNGQYSLSGEALSQWRCSTQVDNGLSRTKKFITKPKHGSGSLPHRYVSDQQRK